MLPPKVPPPDGAQRPVAVAGVEEIGVGLALQDRPPAALAAVGRIQADSVIAVVRSSEAESATRTTLLVPLKLKRVAVAALGRPAAPVMVPVLPVARRIGGGRAGPLTERPGAHQARRRRRGRAGGGLGHSRVTAQVARRRRPPAPDTGSSSTARQAGVAVATSPVGVATWAKSVHPGPWQRSTR